MYVINVSLLLIMLGENLSLAVVAKLYFMRSHFNHKSYSATSRYHVEVQIVDSLKQLFYPFSSHKPF